MRMIMVDVFASTLCRMSVRIHLVALIAPLCFFTVPVAGTIVPVALKMIFVALFFNRVIILII